VQVNVIRAEVRARRCAARSGNVARDAVLPRGSGVGRHHHQRHPEAGDIAASPVVGREAGTRTRRPPVVGPGFDVVVPAAPVVPHNEDGGGFRAAPIFPAAGRADAVNDVPDPVGPKGEATLAVARIVRVVRPLLIRDDPANCRQVAPVEVIEDRRVAVAVLVGDMDVIGVFRPAARCAAAASLASGTSVTRAQLFVQNRVHNGRGRGNQSPAPRCQLASA